MALLKNECCIFGNPFFKLHYYYYFFVVLIRVLQKKGSTLLIIHLSSYNLIGVHCLPWDHKSTPGFSFRYMFGVDQRVLLIFNDCKFFS